MYVLEIELRIVHFACVQRKSSCSRERDRRPSSGPILGLNTTSIVFSGPSKHPGTYSGVTCASSGAPVRDTADDDAAYSMIDRNETYWVPAIEKSIKRRCRLSDIRESTVPSVKSSESLSDGTIGEEFPLRSRAVPLTIEAYRSKKKKQRVRHLTIMIYCKGATNYRRGNNFLLCTFGHCVRQVFVNHFFICLIANVRKCQTPGLRLKPPGRLGC